MTEEKKEEKIEIPAKFKDIVEKIEAMNVLDLAELVKILEKKFGVSAAMPMMAMPVAGQAVSGGETATVEKTAFNVELKEAGGQKIQVIKVLREALGLGIKEAKDITDGAPKIVKEGMKKEEAEELKKKLETAGAKVELK